MRRLSCLMIILLIIFSNQIFSQNYADKPNSPRNSYGIFGNLNFNLHTADFQTLEGIPSCCPRYETGSGLGFSFGAFSAFPLSDKWELTFRLAYFDLSGKLSTTENIAAVLDPNTNTSVPGEFEHTVDSKLTSLSLAPLLSYRLTDQFRLHIGLRGGFMLDKTFESKEELISPSWGVFIPENSRTREQHSGDIPNASTLDLAGMAGVSFDMPLNSANTFFLVPEAYLTYGFTPVTSSESWNIITFHGGLGLRWAPREIIPPKPPPAPPANPPLPELPPAPQAPALDAIITAVGVKEDGSESAVSILKVEEFLYRRMHPLLNYIFFDENSSVLTNKYHRMTQEQKDNFSIKQLYNYKTMEVYNEILNIVGKRMHAYPQSRMTLIGCNSDEGAEKNNIALSTARANIVKDFLIKEWKIPADRIKIQSRNLPQLPSNPKDPDGIAENRRVEMIANIPQIFEPMIIRDTLRTANPPHIRFKIKINTDIGINSWKLITMQDNKNLRVFQGRGDPPSQIDWELEKEDEQEFVPRFSEPLNYKLQVVDNDNKIWESAVLTLPVDQLTIEKKMFEMIDDKEIDKFSLIMFGFNQSKLSEANKRIADFAKKRIQPNSTVTIKGYSDRVGEENYNQKLSEKRALETAKYLGIAPSNAVGVGEKDLLYDNDTPEGRFYSRTVTIEIVTVIQ